MLDQSTRTAILRLRDEGHGVRAIARALRISRGAVRGVLSRGSAEVPRLDRAELAAPHDEDVRALYAYCKGNLVRVHEELVARGAALSYTALTAYCRRHGIGREPPRPAGRYEFAPGEEMQHDTSPHTAKIGGALVKVQTASVVLCYSRMLFIQLYPTFNRFLCKVFLTDALRFFGGAARRCMIDNTHVVVLHGTGREMVPVPEMAAFAERFGFAFAAHEKGDANRSARVEGPFSHVENNFLAGREFTDLAHANREAVLWCQRVNADPKTHFHTSRCALFAVEQPSLVPLPAWVPDVYQVHTRIVDLEGYVHLHGNTYSVPWRLIGRRLELRETKDALLIFDGPRMIVSHAKIIGANGRHVTLPEHRPPRGQGAAQRTVPPEQRELAGAEPEIAAYAAELRKRAGLRWPASLRRLAEMRREYPRPALLAAVAAAAHYGMYDLDRLERMVLRNVADQYFVLPTDSPADGREHGAPTADDDPEPTDGEP